MTRPDDPTYTAAEVCAALELALPTLAPIHARHLARGWDHDVFAVNDAWAFRVARNVEADAALDVEIPLLPWLGPQLSAAIPVVQHSGRMPNGLRFAGHRFLPGSSICDSALEPEARARLAPALARFVRALHAIDPPADLRPDPLDRLGAARRGSMARATLDHLRESGRLDVSTTRDLLAAMDRAEALALPAARCIVHADLHTRNLLVHAGALSGVLDWVDVCAAHPAIDLAVAFEVLPPTAHARFFAEYGDVDEPTRHWAQWRAITHTTAALSGTLARGDSRFARACQVALAEMANA